MHLSNDGKNPMMIEGNSEDSSGSDEPMQDSDTMIEIEQLNAEIERIKLDQGMG
jgi:hypothetical protein